MQAVLRDPARLAAVQASGLLDSPPEPVFDRLAHTALDAVGALRVLITVVDDRRSYIKSDAGAADGRTEVAVGDSLCRHVLRLDAEVVVDDAAADPRSEGSVARTTAGSWGAFPLRTRDGLVLGCLCVLMPHRGPWAPGHLDLLRVLARAVSTEVDLRVVRADLLTARASAERVAAGQRRAVRELVRLADVLNRSLVPIGRWSLGGVNAATAVRPAESPLSASTFIDVTGLPGTRWAVTMGGVTERGARASDLAVYTRQCVRAYGMTAPAVSEVVRGVDHAVHDRVGNSGPGVHLVTVWLSRASEGGLDVECCTAGHLAPVVRAVDGSLRWPATDTRPLGNEVGPVRTVVRERLAPGERLLFPGGGLPAALAGAGGTTSGFDVAARAGLSELLARIRPAVELGALARAMVEAGATLAAGKAEDLVVMTVEPSAAV